MTTFRKKPVVVEDFRHNIDPLIRELLDRLPRVGEVWDIRDREAWFETARAIFNLIYKDKPSWQY